MELAKDYVRHLVHSKSERVSLVLSDTMRSAVWTCFYKIFVDGYQTSFVVCRNCGHILKYTPKDGTTAMRIHMGKFCGRMKAKAIQGAPPTPLIPTAVASASNGMTGVTPSPNIDEPLDLQKPELKPLILGSTVLSSNNNNNNNGGAIDVHPSSQSQQSSPPLSAGNNGAASQSQFPLSRSLHSLPLRQMTPTAKAQEILSAFNPIPPSALPTPKLLYLPGCQPPTGVAVSSSSSSNTPTSPATTTSAATLNNLSAQHRLTVNNSNHRHQPSSNHVQNGGSTAINAPTTDTPCNLVVRRPLLSSAVAADSSSSAAALGRVTSDGIEAVAVAFKAALATFDDDLRELDTKIAETEGQLDKLRSKRLNLLASREHVNKAARVVLSSVDQQSAEVASTRFININGISSSDLTPVDAMIDWVRRNSTASLHSDSMKRSAPIYHATSLSNWPVDLQLQFSRGAKRPRKAYTAVRRGVPTSGLGQQHPALGNASELLNGVVPMTSSSPSKFISASGMVDANGVSENGAEAGVTVAAIGASNGSSVANTPPSSEDMPQDDDGSHGDTDCHPYLNHQDQCAIKSETVCMQQENGSDAMDDSLDESHAGSGNGLTIDCSSPLQLQISASLFDQIVGLEKSNSMTVTSAAVTNAFVFVGTSNGYVIRYEIGTMNRALFTPFGSDSGSETVPPCINCMEAWLFGENDDDFAILLGTDRGVFRIYNPDFSNVLCEKKLNWPITALKVVPKRRLAFVGLKMGVLVSVDLDKMELAAKVVCGFGSIIDLDWLSSPTADPDDFLLFVATEDGIVSVRDNAGQVIASVDFSKGLSTPVGKARAMMTDSQIFIVASSQTRRGLFAAQLPLSGKLTTPSPTIVEICGDEDTEICQFGQLSHNSMFTVDVTGKLAVYRLGEGHLAPPQRLFTQEAMEELIDQATPLIHASTLGESCYLIANNGLVKIFHA